MISLLLVGLSWEKRDIQSHGLQGKSFLPLYLGLYF